MAIFFGLYIDEKIEKKILEGTVSRYMEIDSLEDCVKYTEIFFDLLIGDQEDELIENFQKWKTVLMKFTIYDANYFYNQVYSILHPRIYEKTTIACYHNMQTPSLDLAKQEATNIMRSFDIQLKMMFENQDIWADIDFGYSFEQKRFALNQTILLLNELLVNDCSAMMTNFVKSLQDIYDSDDTDKKKLNNYNMPPKKIKQSIKSKKFFSLLEKTNLNYLSANNTIFYIHIVNIAYAINNLTDTLENHNQIINGLKNSIELFDSDLYPNQIANLIKNLCKFKAKVRSDRLLQYVIELYFIFWSPDTNDFEDYKDFFAFLFDSKGSKKLFINRLNMEEISIPFSFLLYPSISIKGDTPTHLDNNIHQLCETIEIGRHFLSLKDVSNMPKISNKNHSTDIIGHFSYRNFNFDRI